MLRKRHRRGRRGRLCVLFLLVRLFVRSIVTSVVLMSLSSSSSCQVLWYLARLVDCCEHGMAGGRDCATMLVGTRARAPMGGRFYLVHIEHEHIADKRICLQCLSECFEFYS